MLTSFKVEKLFSHLNVNLPLDRPALVLVGENGSGKSSLLYCLYHTMASNWLSFSPTFESCTLQLDNGLSIVAKKSTLPGKKVRFEQYHRLGVDVIYRAGTHSWSEHSLSSDQELDKRTIENLVNAANLFLLPTKQLLYNETSEQFHIQVVSTGKSMGCHYWSAGEKRLVGLLHEIYIKCPNEFILIIDEPEHSISMEWQKKLLPAILATGQCKLLVAATHSPFIFDNALDLSTCDIHEFIEDAQPNI